MANYKGVGIVFVRNLIQESGSTLENQLIAQLSPQESEIYGHTLSSVWVPMPTAQRIVEKAVPLLYPNDASMFEKFGEARARYNLTGIYKAMLRVTTIDYAITQAAKLWSVSYDQGRAQAFKDPVSNHGVYSVLDYVEFPECFRRIMTGFIAGTLRMTSAKEVMVTHDASTAHEWKWHVQWK